jgi:FkbM family methyltransferase
MVHVHGAAVSDAAAAAEGSISVRRVNLTATSHEYLAGTTAIGQLMNNVAGFSIASDVHVPVDDELSDSVPVVTIDSFGWYSESSTCPRLMKLDVEGVELKVLEGARETIRACKPVLHVENNRGLEHSKALIDWLNAADYMMFADVGTFTQPHSYLSRGQTDFPISVNMLAVPRGFDMSSYAQSSEWLLDFLTPIDVNQPDLGTYTVRVPIIRGAELEVSHVNDGIIALYMTPVVSTIA